MSITPRAHETDEEFYRRIYGKNNRDNVIVGMDHASGPDETVEFIDQSDAVCLMEDVIVDGPPDTPEEWDRDFNQRWIHLVACLNALGRARNSSLNISAVSVHPAERTPCARFSRKFVGTV